MSEHWTTIESAIARQTELDEIGDGDPTWDWQAYDDNSQDWQDYRAELQEATLRATSYDHIVGHTLTAIGTSINDAENVKLPRRNEE